MANIGILIMNRLPSEIQDKIWEIYWKGEFKTRVLDKFTTTYSELKKMDFFLQKHFYKNISEDYDLKIGYYLLHYNKFLNSFTYNRGLYMFMVARKEKLALCFNQPYLKSCFSKVANCYKQICVYCLCNGLPYMSYYTVESFINLSKKVKTKRF